MTKKRCGSIAALIAGLVVMAQPAAAFKKHEHESLSTLALAVALESLQGEMPLDVETEVRAWFLQCSPDAKERKEACQEETSQCVPFGLVTRAVDKVIRPEGLIPSKRLHLEYFRIEAPERCEEARSPTTARMRRMLEETYDAAKLFSFANCRAEKKSRSIGTWLMAVHQNASHFEHCAAAKYNALHDLAVEIATESRWMCEGKDPLVVALTGRPNPRKTRTGLRKGRSGDRGCPSCPLPPRDSRASRSLQRPLPLLNRSKEPTAWIASTRAC